MRYLIIINGPPGYKTFFSSLGEELSKSGHEVSFVADARYSRLFEPNEFADCRTAYFSEYLKSNYGRLAAAARCLPDDAAAWADWFLPELDRFQVYRINLDRDADYWAAIYVGLKEFFQDRINDRAPDAILYENVSNSFAYAAYDAAHNNGIHYLGLATGKVPGRFEVQETVRDECRRVRAIFDSVKNEEESEALWADKGFVNIKTSQPDYMKFNNLGNLSLSVKYLTAQKFRKALTLARGWAKGFESRQWSYMQGHPLRMSLAMVKRAISRRLREPMVRRLFAKPVQGEKYYLYPVHFHPESSTSVLAPFCVDELATIKNIAACLPIGKVLYVKEHSSAYALQPQDFYRTLRVLPNVRLLGPTEDIKCLIEDSEGVITVTGTPGFEALLLGKPVACLGVPFYAALPGVSECTSFSELKDVLATKLAGPSPAESRKILVAYRRYTYDGTLNLMAPPEPIMLRRVARVVEKVTSGAR